MQPHKASYTLHIYIMYIFCVVYRVVYQRVVLLSLLWLLHYLLTHRYVWTNNYRSRGRVCLYCCDEYSLNVLSGKQTIRRVAGLLLIDNCDSGVLG